MTPRFTAMCAPRWSPLENLHEGCSQCAQLLARLGLNGLDLRGVAEAFEQLAEPGLAFLGDLLPGREATFATGWTVDSIIAEQFAASLPGDGAHAWLALLTRI
jgi:hypothetical protein